MESHSGPAEGWCSAKSAARAAVKLQRLLTTVQTVRRATRSTRFATHNAPSRLGASSVRSDRVWGVSPHRERWRHMADDDYAEEWSNLRKDLLGSIES
jgi:hypothetical protein